MAAASTAIARGEAAVTATVSSSDLRRAAWTSSLGSALEYYDFALYSLAAALIFGPLVFPTSDPSVALLSSFGTYFVGFAARPFGGILFGVLGDRIGRKQVLLMTLLLMGAASTLIGCLPTYASVGIWSPIMLVALRILQGLGAGAEQAGAAVLMAECSPANRRGFYASLPFTGVQLGTALAALVYLIFLRNIVDVTQTDLWRLPFLLSVVIIAVAFWMRLKLKESPQFSALKATHQVAQRPLRDLLKSSARTLGIVVGLRMAENGGSSIYQALAVSYIVTVMGAPGAVGSVSLLAAALVGAAVVPVAGWLTDRFGRVPVYRGFALFQLLAAVPVWWVLSQGDPVASVIACSIAFAGVSGMFGAQGALLPELFGARHRYIGVSAARETSAVIAGGVAPLIGAWLIGWSASELGSPKDAWIFIAAYLCLLTTITLLTTFVTPEPRARDLGDLHDAVHGKRNGNAS